jgi:hypothetical protein
MEDLVDDTTMIRLFAGCPKEFLKALRLYLEGYPAMSSFKVIFGKEYTHCKYAGWTPLTYHWLVGILTSLMLCSNIEIIKKSTLLLCELYLSNDSLLAESMMYNAIPNQCIEASESLQLKCSIVEQQILLF